MSLQAKVFQSIVIGLGGHGSASLYHLSKHLGSAVLGIESQPSILHSFGSSHGESRIIRHIYQEDAFYVPLLTQSYKLFRELENLTSQRILVTTGCLSISSSSMNDNQGEYGHSCFDGAVITAEQFDLPHSVFQSTKDIEDAFPGFQLPDQNYKGLYDPAGGFVNPEKTIQSHCDLAQNHGATVLTNTTVTGIIYTENKKDPLVHVKTTSGIFKTNSVVIAAGHEMARLIPALKPVLSVERQVVGWFRAPLSDGNKLGLYSTEKFPVFLLDDRENYFYGFPEDSSGLMKIGKYHHLSQQIEDTENVDRAVHADDERALRGFFDKYMAKNMARAPMEKSSVCTFTNTPDGHFIIDCHPNMPHIVFVSACSGHGFKFAPVIGEIASDLILHGQTKHNIDMFRIRSSRKGFEHVRFV